MPTFIALDIVGVHEIVIGTPEPPVSKHEFELFVRVPYGMKTPSKVLKSRYHCVVLEVQLYFVQCFTAGLGGTKLQSIQTSQNPFCTCDTAS